MFPFLLPCLFLLSRVSAQDASTEDRVHYDNFSLYRVWTRDGEILQEDFLPVRILSPPDRRSPFYDLIVAPDNESTFLGTLHRLKWHFQVLREDIQEAIDEEEVRNSLDGRAGDFYSWDRYHAYDTTVEWMEGLAGQFPGEVSLFDLGLSHEKRRTPALKLSRGCGKKSAVFLEAGVHAREWISPAVATWIFHHLVTSEDAEARELSAAFDWYLVPLVNPDGYVYTRRDRLWRKNRRRSGLCRGTDLNRNFGYQWRRAGIAFTSCSDTYAGSSALSEPETSNLDRFMGTIRGHVKLYLSLHAYSQLLLWPNGHTRHRIPEYRDYEQIANATAGATARRYGTHYEWGSVSEVLYAASGSSIDHMRAVHKIPLAFCWELRPERKSRMGFMLEPRQIVPTAEETFDGIVAMVREAQRLGYM